MRYALYAVYNNVPTRKTSSSMNIERLQKRRITTTNYDDGDATFKINRCTALWCAYQVLKYVSTVAGLPSKTSSVLVKSRAFLHYNYYYLI